MGQSCIKRRNPYVDKLDARNPLDFSLLNTSSELLIDQNICLPDLSLNCSQYVITGVQIAVRQEVNNLESLVVVQELGLAINLALYIVFMKLR